MLTEETKAAVLEAMQAELERQGTKAKLGRKLGISSSQVTRVMKGETDGVLSKGNWYNIARVLEVPVGGSFEIKAARTDTFKYITEQLEECQQESISLVLCDTAGIGKTFTAKHYVRTKANAVYIDCSQVKTKQRLVRQIAKEFGMPHEMRYHEVKDTLVHYLKEQTNTLVVLDEAGDLDYPAFLELKALWNATEGITGWYMMGADGLRAKIDRARASEKVGYAEIFDRYGDRYQRATPEGGEEAKRFYEKQVALVAMANDVEDVQRIVKSAEGSLRRLKLEIVKLKRKTA